MVCYETTSSASGLTASAVESNADALDALANTDARLPAEQRVRATALVAQPGERRLQAIHRDRTLPAERAERVLAELAEREHQASRHAHDRLLPAGEPEHV